MHGPENVKFKEQILQRPSSTEHNRTLAHTVTHPRLIERKASTAGIHTLHTHSTQTSYDLRQINPPLNRKHWRAPNSPNFLILPSYLRHGCQHYIISSTNMPTDPWPWQQSSALHVEKQIKKIYCSSHLSQGVLANSTVYCLHLQDKTVRAPLEPHAQPKCLELFITYIHINS
jgi:hypothetical protein